MTDRRLRPPLLAWYRPRRRAYPWRGETDPYRILVAEFMSQQTQVSRVVPAYLAFLRRFPTVRALARAPRGEVIRAWAGLGYNRRAVALSETARAIAKRHGGRVPDDPAILTELPGVGPYTAGAVASMAYGRPVPAVDTNARRVVARVLLGVEPSEASDAELREAAVGWLDRADPASWNQAVMDLGHDVCRTRPRCEVCPLEGGCRYRRSGRVPISLGRQASGDGSRRRLRGRIVRELATRQRATLGSLAEATGEPADRVAEALGTLASDGLVVAGPAALGGRSRGRVTLPA